MRLCHRCDCHVFTQASACPHCGAPFATTVAPRPFKFGATALSAGLLLGCASSDDGETDSASTTMTTSGSESTGDGDGDGDGDTTGTGTTTMDDTEDNPTGEAAYGIAEVPCDWLDPEPVVEGDNPVSLGGDLQVVQSCADAASVMNLFVFTAEVAGSYEFSVVDAEFPVALSTLDHVCEPAVEQACTRAPGSITEPLEAGAMVHVAVGSSAGGDATLSIVKR